MRQEVVGAENRYAMPSSGFFSFLDFGLVRGSEVRGREEAVR